MRFVDWTGEYHFDRAEVRGLFFYRFLEDEKTRLELDRPELYALFADVCYYPEKFDAVTSVLMIAGLTLTEAELEIKITSPRRAAKHPLETIDYRKVNFWGQKHLGMKPGDTVYCDPVKQPQDERVFGLAFR